MGNTILGSIAVGVLSGNHINSSWAIKNMTKRVTFIDSICRWVVNSPFARGILVVIPFGKGLHEFIVSRETTRKARDSQPSNEAKCEAATTRLVEWVIARSSPNSSYGDEVQWRHIIYQILAHYKDHPDTVELPSSIPWNHGDERDSETVGELMVREIYLQLKNRGYFWVDPYTDKTYFTKAGIELLNYLEKTDSRPTTASSFRFARGGQNETEA
jgi:hypothetical protein